jgi:hypothetical protein
MEDDSINQELDEIKTQLNNIILNDNYSDNFNLFTDGKTFIGFYSINDTNHWLVSKNVYDYESKTLDFDSLLLRYKKQPYYISYNSPFITISSSNNLLNQFHYNSTINEKKHNELTQKMKFSSQMSKISCLLDLRQFSEIHSDSSLINPTLFSSYNNSFEDWIQFDIDYSPKELKIVGISNQIDSLKLDLPNYFSFSELVPEEFTFLEKKTLNIILDSSNKEKISLQSMRIKFFDNIQNKEHDLLVIENPVDSGYYSRFISSILIDSLVKKVGHETLRVINKDFASKLVANFEYEDKYCFLSDYYIIISMHGSKKELDYMLARKPTNSIDKAILETKNNKYYDQAQSFFLYQNREEITKSLKKNINRYPPLFYSFLNAIEGASWTINNFSNRLHHGLVINKKKTKRTDKNILWKLDVPLITWGPYTLNNHRTGTKDIVVLDSSNIFYLIGANGKIKWTKTLSSPIVGGISQIDAYHNNKYQMVFNTKKEIHILDILGNEIDNFPIKFQYNASNPVAVFDYDNNYDYRLVLSSEDGALYNYNLDGKKVKGWEIPRLKNTTYYQLNHFAINGKDYIFSLQENGQMNLFNRKGINRYKVNNSLPIVTNGSFQINKSFKIDSSSLFFEDTLGTLSEFKFCGLNSILPLKIDGEDSIFLLKSKGNNELSYYVKNEKSLKIIDEGDQSYLYSFTYQFDLITPKGLKNYTGVFNPSIGEIQLIDNKFRLNPTYFRGSKSLTVEDVNNDNSIELLTILNETILICYQIPILK